MQLNTNRREVAVSSSRKEMQLNRIRRGAHELQVGKFKRRKGMIKQILKKHFLSPRLRESVLKSKFRSFLSSTNFENGASHTPSHTSNAKYSPNKVPL